MHVTPGTVTVVGYEVDLNPNKGWGYGSHGCTTVDLGNDSWLMICFGSEILRSVR